MSDAVREEFGDLDERFIPAVDMIGRTGAKGFQIRVCEEEDPAVWFAVATYKRGKGEIHDAAAAMNPVLAVFRLCEQLMDGGRCAHCKRPTGFIPDLNPTIANELICWYQWDPERKTFRRSCEGETETPESEQRGNQDRSPR